jgi:hypothetical protein
LTVDETYYVQFSSWQPAARGEYSLEYSCSGVPPAPARPDEYSPDVGAGTRNRYLSFDMGHQGGRTQSIRVTFQSLPPPFDALNGTVRWVGTAMSTSETSGTTDPGAGATFQTALIECDPVPLDWSAVGVIHVFDRAIFPGAAYDVQVVNAGLEDVESAFSEPLTVVTSRWGDLVGDCSGASCSSPDGDVNFDDIAAIVDKFKNLPNAIQKSRADIAPEIVDRVVDFVDIPLVVNAFRGLPYPWGTPSLGPCP